VRAAACLAPALTARLLLPTPSPPARARAEVLEALERKRVRASRLSAAASALDTCLATTQLCARVVDAVEAGQYYAALRLLDRVRAERLPLLPCGALRDYVARQLPATEALVEERAKGLLDAWLADAAAAARGIGRRAVAAAASARATVQARWEAQLAGVRACGAAGRAPPGALPFTLRGAADEEDEEPLEGLSLAPVATARHALACLGKEDAFWAHYTQRRAAQLSEHLSPPQGAFLECYQAYFGAVAGFFVVEGHVARACGGGAPALSPARLAASWDRAAGALSTLLAAQLCVIPSAGEMLLVSDYVALLTAALQSLGLWTAALDAALHEAHERYHALASDDTLARLARAVARDSLEPLTLRSASEYAADVTALGLHPAGEAAPSARDFPLVAPFTPLVPALLRMLRAHTGDSVAFCGATGEEGVRTVSRYRDALLARVIEELLAPQLAGATSRSVAPAHLVQLAANAAALDGAADAADAECAHTRVPARAHVCVPFTRCAHLTAPPPPMHPLPHRTAWLRCATWRKTAPPRSRWLRLRLRACPPRRAACCARSASARRRRCCRASSRKSTPSSRARRWRSGCLTRRARRRARLRTRPPRSCSTRWARRAPCCCPPPRRGCAAARWDTPRTRCWRRCCGRRGAASTCMR
jgi:hypothetical protein